MKCKLLMLYLLTLILCCSAGSEAFAQGRFVSGKVISEDAEGIPGVNVAVKGSTSGTTTNANGEYRINVSQPGAILVFSSIGFLPVEKAAGSQSVLDITLKTDVRTLNEVVVTALGIEREKKALGYSTQEIQGSSLTEARETNIANSLKGKVAGVHINNSAGGPGGSSYVVIRGGSSLTGSSQPLYVVDGVPIDNQTLDGASLSGGRDYGDGIGNVNPDDVETVTVLKGPSAASLYGARGANGVILITTKKGTKKKGIGVDFNSNTTFETPNVLQKYQNVWGGGYGGTYSSFGKTTYEGVEYPLWTNTMYDHWGGKMDGRLIMMAGMPEKGPVAYTPQPDNNIRDFYRVGQTYTNTIAVSGGNKSTSMRLSISDMRNKHILPTTSLNRQTISLTFNSNISEKLSVEGRVNYVRQEGQNRPNLGGGSANPISALNLLSRYVDLDWLKNYKRADGSMVNYIVRAPHNPYWVVNEFLSDDKRDRMMGYIRVKYQFTDWLSLQARTGTDFYGDTRNERIGIGTTGAATIRGEVKSNDWKVREDNSDVLLTANGKLIPGLTGSVSLGANRMSRYQAITGFTGSNLILDDVYHISNAANVVPRSGLTRKEIQSVFGMAQLAYRDILFLDITSRNDWSSSLGLENQSFFYPSVSTSFVFSDAFKLSNSFLSFGKIRASYAQAGKDANPYQTTAGYSLSNVSFNDQKFLQIGARIPLTNLKNELTTSYEFGADLKLFKNRIGIDLTYYDAVARNQIVPLPLSATTGYNDRMINAGEIRNKGFELLLTGSPFANKKSLTWNVTLNLSRNKSRVVELYDGVEALSLLNDANHASIEARPGQPYGNIVGYKYLKNEEGKLILNPTTGAPQRTTDKHILGNIQPDFLGGLTNEFSFKGVSLSALIDFRRGGQIFSHTKRNEMANGTGKFTEERGDGVGMEIDGVIKNSDGTYEKYMKTVTPQNYYAPRAWSYIAEEFVIDADYISLREISLGYSIPVGILAKSPFKKAKLSVVARNLAYLYQNEQFKIMGVSPEAAYSSTAAAQGVESYSMPTTRSVGFNLSLSF
jgi:TonB-linked SusC/RagA family outer membrane protein